MFDFYLKVQKYGPGHHLSSPVGRRDQNRADTAPDGCSNGQKPDQTCPDLSSPVGDNLSTQRNG